MEMFLYSSGYFGAEKGKQLLHDADACLFVGTTEEKARRQERRGAATKDARHSERERERERDEGRRV